MNYEIIDLAPIRVVGLQIRTTNENAKASEDISKVWDLFYQENTLQNAPHQTSDDIMAVYSDYELDYTKPYNFTLGRSLALSETLPPGLVLLEIPSAKYAHFSLKGPFPQCLIEAWQWIWENDLKLQRTYTYDLEIYPGDFDRNNAKLDIYIATELPSE